MKRIVLIIEDELSSARLLEFKLQKEFKAVIKGNGLEAMEWLNEGNIPSVIIADLNMPRMNGYELIAKLKSHPAYSKIPLIIVSGEENHFIKNKCYVAGANRFFAKPINTEDVVESVKELIEVSLLSTN